MNQSQNPSFVPALIIVDLQEDFCPPNGSIPVPNGRDVVPIINKLLDLPFAVKIATNDWHPETHVSFFSNHPGNLPDCKFTSVQNPLNPREVRQIRLWPNHCIAGTPGAELVSELNLSKIDEVIEKGTDERVEMYSGFYDIWGGKSRLVQILKEKHVTHVWVVGLALDYCVKETAIHAAKEGYSTLILREGTKAIEDAWDQIENDLKQLGVRLVDMNEGGLDKLV